MKKKLFALVLLVSLALALSACGADSLEQRAKNRELCESAGGEYIEHVNGFTYTYSHWNCNLERVVHNG